MENQETTVAPEKVKASGENKYKDYVIRPDVLNSEDIMNMVPRLRGHEKFVEKVMHLFMFDEVNRVHGAWCHDPGPAFARHLIDDEFHTPLRVDNEDVRARFKEGAYITVSNHPFGSIDGIALIALVTKYRPEYKVMVNMILGKITAMGPNFITVDPSSSPDADKRKVSVNGIREALRQLKDGEPLGFFPAGAVSKVDKTLHISDREWQPTVTRLIKQLKVPVIPIYFHGHNSTFFNILGLIDWRLRSARLPKEIFNKRNKEIHISVGEPISVEKQSEFKDYESLGKYLREQTYALAKMK